MAVLSPHLFDAVPLSRAADRAGVPLRTAQRRLASYLDGGAAALSPGGRWLPRMPESLEQLDLLLLTIATPRKVQRDGISLHGLRYFSTTLAAYIGEPVTIRYDPRDLAEIRVYHRGEYLCRAVAPDIATATVSMKDLHAARNQRRRELRQHLTARRDLVDFLLHPAVESIPEPVSTPRASSSTPTPRIKLYRED